MSSFCEEPLQHDEQGKYTHAHTKQTLASCSWAEQESILPDLG